MSDRPDQRVPAALFAISGVLYLTRALMDLGSPEYFDPATLFDYAAVIMTTLWEVALAAAIASLAITHQLDGAARIVAWLPAAALAVAGLANLLEDAFGMSALGIAFGIGGLFTVVGLIALGVSSLLDRRNDRTIGVVLLLLGLAFTLPAIGRLAGVGIICLLMAYVLGRRTDRSDEPGSTAEAVEASETL